jgi:histidinol-phosphate/aromatic aminotransferase/cobyric acid decarboxylase-like protein
MLMESREASPLASLRHGGDLTAARALFPNAPEPFIDLSTGINPYAYPLPGLPETLFARLPDAAALRRLAEVAARAYGVLSADHVVCAPGTQILLPLVAGLMPPGRAVILGPTYAEHRRTAALAGHDVIEVDEVDQLGDARLAVVVNPNNPDGRILPKSVLVGLADERWKTATRARLIDAAQRLDALLARAGLEVIGGTSLYRLTRRADAADLFAHLGRSGILVRRFTDTPSSLRWGLPNDEPQWERLRAALESWRR